jgi:hypothetical protein
MRRTIGLGVCGVCVGVMLSAAAFGQDEGEAAAPSWGQLGLDLLKDATQSEAARAEAPQPGSVDHLLARMTGSFSSQAQAEADPENYFDIRLHMVRIWADRADGVWLYVEQAAARALDRPYRQRVYRLFDLGGGAIRSEVYEFPEPLRFAGAWQTPDRFAAELKPEDLDHREGCDITLHYFEHMDAFVGFTIGTGCATTLAGGHHATSEAIIDADGLTTWDRGWNEAGEQVWGAELGGYRFDRVAE